MFVLTAALHAQSNGAAVLTAIRQEGLQRSHVGLLFDHLTTNVGPRLTGSPEYKAAADWAREALHGWGLSNARLEAWEFGRGWQLDGLTVEMVQPRYMPLIGYAEAWSPPTSGEIVASPVFVGGASPSAITTMKDAMRGGIVMTQPMASFIQDDRPQPTASNVPVRIGQPPNPGPRPTAADARQLAQAVREAGAAVIVRTSAGEHGTVFVLGRDQRENAVPTVVLAGEHYNLVARMAQRGIPVKLRINIRSRFLTDDTKSYNVIAELPGTDAAAREEIVLLGAHLDSWHTGTGATDNADGSAAVLEAMRILKAAGIRPRRTIRVALWGGEEQGLLGSRAYVAQHLAGDANAEARNRHFIYLNIDPGMGPVYRVVHGKQRAGPRAVRSLAGAARGSWRAANIDQGIGNTDHLSFRNAGVPGFRSHSGLRRLRRPDSPHERRHRRADPRR